MPKDGVEPMVLIRLASSTAWQRRHLARDTSWPSLASPSKLTSTGSASALLASVKSATPSGAYASAVRCPTSLVSQSAKRAASASSVASAMCQTCPAPSKSARPASPSTMSAASGSATRCTLTWVLSENRGRM